MKGVAVLLALGCCIKICGSLHVSLFFPLPAVGQRKRWRKETVGVALSFGEAFLAEGEGKKRLGTSPSTFYDAATAPLAPMDGDALLCPILIERYK